MPFLKSVIRISTNSQNSLDMRLEFAPYLLYFKEPSGTSRGILTEKPTFFIKIYDEKDPSRFGIGEAAVFPGLSPEADGYYVNKLTELMANVAIGLPTDLSRHSSISFGFEQAIYDFSNNCQGIYFPGEFTEGEKELEINGLIWMGDFDRMIERIEEKIEAGFRCIKLKIGALKWDEELEMLRYIRNKYSERDLVIRVDANGAFNPSACLSYLNQLAEFEIHSIEQPIKAGNAAAMAEICRQSPVAVALDEELIRKYSTEERIQTLEEIKPSYIVLKPALCGGFQGAMEWIDEARKRDIGFWITSALESNIGLNAIAQFTAFIGAKGAQGLGTGALFTNNFSTPLYLEKDKLRYHSGFTLDKEQFADLKWHR